MNNERVSIERGERIASQCFSGACHCNGSGAYRDELVALAFGAYRASLEAANGMYGSGFQSGLFPADFGRFREIFLCTDIEHRLRFIPCVADCCAYDGSSAAFVGSRPDRPVGVSGQNRRSDFSGSGKNCACSSMAVRSDPDNFVSSGCANKKTVGQASFDKNSLGDVCTNVTDTDINVGKWRKKNRRKKEAKKRKKEAAESKFETTKILVSEESSVESKIPLWRRKPTTVKKLPQSALDVKLGNSLTERRIAENELNAALARKKLREVLESEEVLLSQDLPKQERVKQWINPDDSIERVQSPSLVDRCATLPSSSAGLSSGVVDRISVDSSELRTLAKAKADVDYELECALKYIQEVEPLVEKKFIVPACAKTEDALGDMYYCADYTSSKEDLDKMLRSHSQEFDIRNVPHAERFEFRLKQVIERNRLNIDCGF